jgi:hypothetical protein
MRAVAAISIFPVVNGSGRRTAAVLWQGAAPAHNLRVDEVWALYVDIEDDVNNSRGGVVDTSAGPSGIKDGEEEKFDYSWFYFQRLHVGI